MAAAAIRGTWPEPPSIAIETNRSATRETAGMRETANDGERG
jgi:hypothetical protein